MASVKNYSDLRVYQSAFECAQQVYELTKRFPAEERYSLADQIRRSSRSICANLAEAWRKRRYPAAFVSKLSDADAEAAETGVWLDFARRCRYIRESDYLDLADKYNHICAQLTMMMNDPDKWCNKTSGGASLRRSSPLALRSSGFTLVELLVVISIIMLLAGILVPTVSGVLKSASVTRAKARINEIADGVEAFRMDTANNPAGLYPGQPPDKLESGTFQNNGSALLRDALSNTTVEYVPFKEKDILNVGAPPVEVISDRFSRNPMAILYYPSRIGQSGMGQFLEADNSAITANTDPATVWNNSAEETNTFANYIKDRRFDGNASTTPYNSGGFLLIAAGKDRVYGTTDDLTNWK